MDLFDIVAARAGGGSGGGTPQVQSNAVDYYFAIEDLRETMNDSNKKYLSTAFSYPDDTSMTFDLWFRCGEIDGDNVTGYFGLPVEICDEATVASDQFANWEYFSGLAIYNNEAFGDRFLTLDKIGEMLLALDYCTTQATLVVPFKGSGDSKPRIGLHYVIKMTFASKDIRDGVINTMFAPVFSEATYYRLTCKKPNPQAEIGG